MIVKEYYMTRDDGVKLYKTYSDTNHYIQQLPTYMVYDIAIDVENALYMYIEMEDVITTEEENKE